MVLHLNIYELSDLFSSMLMDILFITETKLDPFSVLVSLTYLTTGLLEKTGLVEVGHSDICQI